MANPNHNPKEYTPSEVADIVERSPALIRMFASEGKIDHKKFGRTYVITERGLQQAREIVKNSKPGPKGPRKNADGRKAA